MSIYEARKHLEKFNRENDVLEFDKSSATVQLAAEVLNVEPGRIAKSISLKNGEGAILIVTAGDTNIDNKKFKAEFGIKAKMLTPEETMEYIGHPIGGVCPFGLKEEVPIFLDESLKRFETVYPACGSSNSAIKLTCSELEEYSESKKWVDVCKNRSNEG